MKMQFVFGNPTKGKSKVKKKSKKKGGSKVAKKKKTKKGKKRRGLVAGKSGKTLRHSRKKKSPRIKVSSIGNPKRRKKGKHKKNPYYATWIKKPQAGSSAKLSVRKTQTTLRPDELRWLKDKISSQQSLISKLDKQAVTFAQDTGLKPSAIKAIATRQKAALKKLEAMLKRGDVSAAQKKQTEEQLKKLGYEYMSVVNTGNIAEGGKFGLAGKKKRSKKKSKKSKKKKAAKKKAGKKKKGSRRRKARKSMSRATRNFKSYAKRAGIASTSNPKRRKGKRKKVRSIKLKKGQSIKLVTNPRGFKIKRTNPLGGFMGKVEEVLGHSIQSMGFLALAGAGYAPVNYQLSKLPVVGAYIKKANAQVPGLGSGLAYMTVGAILNALGKRQGSQAAVQVGEALVAAAVVGLAAGAQSKFLPAASGAAAPSLTGVDYTMEGYGEGDDADFGLLPEGMGQDDADFGGVDYTMEGVDYTMEGDDAQMGEGDDADFGAIPDGLGQGQMG